MIKNLVLALVLGLVISSVTVAANCGGATPCNCGDTLTSSRTLTASDNLAGCTGSNALIIGADNVMLNCNNHMIQGTATNGIYVYNKDHVSIYNCNILNFTRSIYSYGTEDNIYAYNHIYGPFYGVYAVYASDLIVENNDISSYYYGVIDIYGGDTNHRDNNIDSGNCGFYIRKGSGAHVNITDNELTTANYLVRIVGTGAEITGDIDLQGNYFYVDLGRYGIYNTMPTGNNVDAEYNYWKYQSTGENLSNLIISLYVYDYYDNSAYSIVDYLPRLY